MNDTRSSPKSRPPSPLPTGLPNERRPLIMGILNLTPESFSDGGRFFRGDSVDPQAVAAGALAMARAGADIVDIGAEATSFHRPGITPTPPEEQIRRMGDALLQTRRELDDSGFSAVAISIDTRSAGVAEAALDRGAAIINDVSGGCSDAAMLPLAARAGCPIILMHAWPESGDQPPGPRLDVVSDVIKELSQMKAAALAAGVKPDRVILDPGIGFGKASDDNWQILRKLGDLDALGCPIAIGFSRKRLTCDLLPPHLRDWQHRDIASAILLSAVHHPTAAVYRVHDVVLTAVARAALQRMGRRV